MAMTCCDDILQQNSEKSLDLDIPNDTLRSLKKSHLLPCSMPEIRSPGKTYNIAGQPTFRWLKNFRSHSGPGNQTQRWISPRGPGGSLNIQIPGSRWKSRNSKSHELSAESKAEGRPLGKARQRLLQPCSRCEPALEDGTVMFSHISYLSRSSSCKWSASS